MSDMSSAIPPALAAFAAEVAARPIIPANADLPTLHLGASDLPWAEAGDGSALQLLHVDLALGIWISKSRIPPGHKVIKHFHTGMVYAVTLQGGWFYEESPEAVNGPGSYLFEPAGSVHTLCTPADQDGDTIAWFAVHGANINLNADGKIVSLIDARAALDIYRGYCKALGLDCSRLIVVGE
ncbi:2,4'-dihydroxyacetophenone dioxygenase family protein [Novosphingobium sp.]|uniref:2,4'-dihydroxyacetophenone dioxygenase family protein n=1 Tax=Novosphingobium sp. TaxID=1874826 RepID=UPI0038BCC617